MPPSILRRSSIRSATREPEAGSIDYRCARSCAAGSIGCRWPRSRGAGSIGCRWPRSPDPGSIGRRWLAIAVAVLVLVPALAQSAVIDLIVTGGELAADKRVIRVRQGEDVTLRWTT